MKLAFQALFQKNSLPCAITLALLATGACAHADEISFRNDILPILSENCFNCHGPASNTRKGGLRLDQRDAALLPAESGKAAIVPGNPDASPLLSRLLTHDPDEVMPPPDSKKTLPPGAADKFRRWIAEGAVYQKHWAFDAIQRPSPPSTASSSWPRNPIDQFILAKLSKENLTPSPEAAKPALLRRVSLDLTGLPPSPQELQTFLDDNSPDAYERVVDRLLASPRYGERMALPWLDAARYADSNGFQQDGDHYQYVWRDWVVRALNTNLPFDQFAIEQLAGDLLPNSTPDQKVATAFNRNHLLNGEGGAIPEEQRHIILFDRVDVTATTFLGLTLACAQCHDHKYDPIPQADYYRMMAFFNNVPETGQPPGGGQYRIADPWIHAGNPEQLNQLTQLTEAARLAAQEPPTLAAAQAEWEKTLQITTEPQWRSLRPDSATSDQEVKLSTEEDLSIIASGPRPDKATYRLQLPPSDQPITGIRIDTIPDTRNPSAGAGRSDSGNAVLTRLRIHTGNQEVPLSQASADYSQGGFSPEGALDDNSDNGWAFYPNVTTPHFLIIQPTLPIPPGQQLTLTLEFLSRHAQHQLGRFKISITHQPDPVATQKLPAAVRSALSKASTARTPAENQALHAHFIEQSQAPSAVQFRQTKQQTELALNRLRDSLPRVMVMSDAKPRKTHLLDRGNYLAPLAEVSANTPECLPPMASDLPRNRLGFARWLMSPENPLTARVQVNRYWQLFFGTGIVKSSENLGVQAEPPTHPELLDWLASEFRDSGWNVKHLHRLIVTSATYRQSAVVSPALLERDPENKLLARAPRFRLSSMLLRDLALSSSGLLVEQLGGKPVYPYQPKGIWDGLSITKERDFTYPQSTGQDLYRRSLYTFWRRTVAPGNMFDASSRNTCSVKPSQTNTPLHALTTLNDTTWVEAARSLALKAIEETSPQDPDAQLRRAFLRACSRAATPAEISILRRSYDKALTHYSQDSNAAEAFLKQGTAASTRPIPSPQLAALSAVCLSILNLDEALNRG